MPGVENAGAIETLFGAAVSAHTAGDLVRARTLYDAVLRIDSQQPDALHMLGLIAQQSGDVAQARALLERSIDVRPHDARTQFDLGGLCQLQGDREGAIRAYEASARLDPDCADVHTNLACAYREAGRRDDALRAYAAAIRARPDFAPAYANIAAVLIDLERYDEAIRILERALSLAPELAELHANLGQAYRRTGRFHEAIAASRRAIALRPDDRSAYLNVATAAYEIDAFDEALDACRAAVALDPASAQTQYNLAWLCYATGRFAEAITANDAAIATRPDFIESHANLALALLAGGNFARGWTEYPWIWRLPAKRQYYPYLDRATLWNGEPFAGRELLVTREQGFGDALLVARYLPAIKARGGRVILEAAPELAALFAELAGVDELRVVQNGTRVRDDVDLHVPLLGIPRAFGTDLTTVPTPIPYLRATPERIERWGRRLTNGARVRVGIVWAGSAGQGNNLDHRRAARLEDFATLASCGDIAWIGLQKGRDEERRSCNGLELDPLGCEIRDFADTAAILTQLDLVIAVDTAVAHLAGALGLPVWTLLAFPSEWRWLPERNDSLWYPTMRLFRQPHAGDWAPVFADVRRELREWVLRTPKRRAARLEKP